MKKFFAFLLVFAMMFSLCGVAMAAGIDNQAPEGSKQTSGDVVVEVENTVAETVYYVVITWGDLTFTYDFDMEYNAETHKQSAGDNAKWDGTSGTITVTNHSNIGIKVSGKFSATDSGSIKTNGVTATLDKTELALPSAVDKATDAAELTDIITVTISGTPDQTSKFDVGTINLTITAN